MKNDRKQKNTRSFNLTKNVNALEQAILRDLGSFRLSVTTPNLPGALVYASQQKEKFRKKLVPQRGTPQLRQAAFDKFKDVNKHMGVINDQLDGYLNQLSISSCIARADYVGIDLLRARAFIEYVLWEEITLDDLFEAAKHSSGTSIGLKYSETNLEDKWRYPLSGTPEAIRLFELYEKFDPLMAKAVRELNRYSDQPKYKVISATRATTVRKNDEIDRLIAIEATLNMFFQKALETLLRRKIEFYVDLRTAQYTHQELARIASITSKISTLDWRSASDCNSAVYIKWLMMRTPTWYCALNAVRCDMMSLGDELVKLNMFSTMGNATTFPLETLSFYALLYARTARYASKHSVIPEEGFKPENASVFGDDCILPTACAPGFIASCRTVGFLLNDEKSFYKDEGFRESCGADYYRGYNVRPYMVQAPTSTKRLAIEAWLYIQFNSVIKKYISYFGTLTYCYQPHFLSWMRNALIENNIEVKFVPDHFPDDSGLKIQGDTRLFLFFSQHCKLAKIGYCKRTQTHEFSYLRFVYFNRNEGDDCVRYATWLKRPSSLIEIFQRKWSIPVDEVIDPYISKRKGSYCCSKGLGYIPGFQENTNLFN